ncbi:MAG TPA: transporter associated domain-containing protein [Dokdonella sp.]|uniref:HlyC/CorC family transporter n=1 Tax=Dokdonella sp. TaxID=2291710 RepID=UPI0025BD809A|nr:transporter associated domain-containing protein [Dokdonella sp.]MBX3692076.1 CBS domain-containing protein [Dokdonella sp.]MCW5566964.1 CBS domain-containing protein [Dokdonella sp.]HNR91911.1 transporter associated domain-containing protein [Dokdonella sp.]
MSEDPPSSQPQRSWFGRLTHALSGEVSSREELLEELRDAQANGLLSNDTLSMIEGAIEVSDLTVGDIMVPRAQMVSLPVTASFEEVLDTVIESGHSRFPVHGADRDEIVGILLAKDLLRCFSGSGKRDFRPLLRPVALIPESKRLNILLKEFRLSHHHMAIVVDEYGGVGGLVTIEDVLEQIVGDIDDEHDDEETPNLIQPQPDGRFLVAAITPISDFNDRFESRFPGDEHDTVGAMLTSAFGHVPQPGEETALGGFLFRVTKGDARRVQQFAVRIHEA